MQKGYFQSKALTRDYSSICSTELPALDVMVARRSWRKYKEWQVEDDFKADFETFIRKSALLRHCPEESLLLITEQNRMRSLFKAAYKGIVGKVNPWLPKSKAAGILVLAIDKHARNEDRALGYAFPTMVGQDAVLWLTEKGIGSVWLAGINGLELAKALDMPSNLWVFAAIAFGKTGHKPRGMNYDNISYQMISRKRKKLKDIIHLDNINTPFHFNENQETALSPTPRNITTSLEALEQWDDTPPAPPVRMIEYEIMLECARIAPSACNRQPWRFVVLDNTEKRKEIADLLKEDSIPQGMIACLGEAGTIYEIGTECPYWLIDVPIAMANLSLMACALGRTCRIYMDIDEKSINQSLKLNSRWRTAGIIGIK